MRSLLFSLDNGVLLRRVASRSRRHMTLTQRTRVGRAVTPGKMPLRMPEGLYKGT